MIVDDSNFMVSVIRNFAAKAVPNLIFLEAHNGEEAVALYRKERPNLVFMDIKMDGMDGLTALKQINADGRAKVVMCTSLKEPELEAQAKAAGAVGYIVKPFRSEDVVEMVKKYA